MKLIELKPQFLRHEFLFTDGINFNVQRRVKTIQQAQGISFLCPACLQRKGGHASTHRVICWSGSAGVSNHISLGLGRWRMTGTGFNDLTLISERDKVQTILATGCFKHGYVTNGDVHWREADVFCSVA